MAPHHGALTSGNGGARLVHAATAAGADDLGRAVDSESPRGRDRHQRQRLHRLRVRDGDDGHLQLLVVRALRRLPGTAGRVPSSGRRSMHPTHVVLAWLRVGTALYHHQEIIKPITQGTDEARKRQARDVLYVEHTSLRLCPHAATKTADHADSAAPLVLWDGDGVIGTRAWRRACACCTRSCRSSPRSCGLACRTARPRPRYRCRSQSTPRR